MKRLQFKLTTETQDITLDGPEGPIELILSEMTAATRDRYLDQVSQRMRLDDQGRTAGLKKFEGMQSELLVLCLQRKDGKELSAKEIQSWPASVVTELFKAAQALNRLDKTEEPVKNG